MAFAPISLADIAGGTGGFVITGAAPGDQFGYSVASAGDINGDGFADLVIGARGSGKSYVVFGSAAGFPASLSLADVAAGSGGFVIDGGTAGDLAGGSVAAAGDVNGDGIADLIIGASGANKAYVVFGTASGFPAAVSLADIASGSGGFAIDGSAIGGNFANRLGAGDVNGDGLTDLIIGDPQATAAAGFRAGEGFVLFGSATGFPATVNAGSLAAGTGGFVLNGQAAGDYAGGSVADIGDINGDGIDDFAVGAFLADPAAGRNAGKAYVVFGTAAGFPAAINLVDVAAGTGGFVLSGEVSYGVAGVAVSAAGDINGDGIADFIVGADGVDTGAIASGRSYVVFGHTGSFAANINLLAVAGGSGGFAINGVAQGDYSGFSVSSAGDINGDGIDDLIIGTAQNTGIGHAYVVFGTAGGFTTPIHLADIAAGTGGFVINGETAGDLAGLSVAAAGDVNGDGFADLVVGAPAAGSGGKSYVILGSDLTGAVTQQGTAGANLLTGSAGIDDLVGGPASDTLVGNGGADVLLGGAGDDVIHVTDFTFRRIDGGGGNNTLALDGSALTLDLASIPNTQLRNIDRLDLGAGSNRAVLTPQSVERLAAVGNTLQVDGTAGDLVSLAGIWQRGATASGHIAFTSGQATVEVSTALPFDIALPAINLADIAVGTGGFAIDGEATGIRSGISVASAGDVNGDGFADLVIGADHAYDSGTFAGKAYVVFGAAGGLPASINLADIAAGTGGFALIGQNSFDFFGHSVASAGDINGDGIADIVVSAYYATPATGSHAGKTYVVFGSATGFPAGLTLAQVSAGTGGFVIDGANAGGFAGFSVASAGDVNGDGIADLVIGARSAGNLYAGRSYVVFGTTGGFPAAIDLADIAAGTGGFAINGAVGGDQSGESVASAGDINGDGFADLLIGTYRNNTPGASFVVFGGPGGFPAGVNLSAAAAGTGGFIINGLTAGDQAGIVIAAAGDVNGDGIADIIVGDPSANKAFVVFGTTAGFPAAINLADVAAGTGGFLIDGSGVGGAVGKSVATAGDVNGDGIDDLVIGAPGNGKSYVVFGRAGGTGAIDLATVAAGSLGFVIDPQNPADAAGTSVAAAGDVNGDGYGDLIVGAPSAAGSAGTSYVIFGRDFTGTTTGQGTASPSLLTGTSAADDLVGGAANDTLVGNGGADVLLGGAGDDAIHISDTLVQRIDGGTGSNTLALDGAGINLDLAAIPETKLRNIATIDLTGGGDNALYLTRQSVLNLSGTSNTLRVGGDAGDSVTLSFLDGWQRGATAGGVTTWTSGNASVQVATAVATSVAIELADLARNAIGFAINGAADSDFAGGHVASAGDVNGDGFDDIIIGVPGAGGPGASYVVFGGPDGIPTDISLADIAAGTGGFVVVGDTATDYSGTSVASAGDVNGDGIADIIIGAPGADGGAGRGYVVFGQSGGFPATIHLADVAAGTGGFVLFGENPGDGAGRSVAAAGDINGDGIADVVIGAPGVAGYAGRSYVVFGTSAGFPAGINLADIAAGTGGFAITGETAHDYSGGSVATAGDLNGDGIADLVIGAGGADGHAGRSYVVFGTTSGFAAGINLATVAAGTGGFVIEGAAAGDRSGYSVASAGDVNGDGVADLIIGAKYAAGGAGASYVVFGHAGGFPAAINLAAVAAGSGGFVITGQAGGDASGASVAAAGDVNGDGFDDLIIGANYAGANYAGKAYVVFGRAGGFPADLNLADIAAGTGGFVLDASSAGERQNAGISVSSAGDLNGDGFADLLVGAPDANPATVSHAGKTDVIYGRDFTHSVTQQGGATAALLTGSAAADDLVGGPANDTLIGNGGADVLLGGAGDDVIHVSDPGFRRVDGGSGNNTLALDGAGQVVDLATTPDTRLRNVATIDLTGSGNNRLRLTAASVLGLSATSNTLHVTGDAGDVLVLASHDGWVMGADAGGVTSWTSGQATVDVADAITVNPPVPGILLVDIAAGTGGFVMTGEASGDGAGNVVASAGDLNGDGFADIVIGAKYANGNSGKSYVVFGGPAGIPASTNLSDVAAGTGGFVITGTAGEKLGNSVASAGDINGDGITDLVVGAYYASRPGAGEAGRSYVIFGSAGGFPAGVNLTDIAAGTGGFAIDGAAGNNGFGASVASAGDINGDGIADLVISAPYADAPAGGNAGETYVVFGTTAGFPTGVNLADIAAGTGGFIINGAAASDRIGRSVAAAGDVNGDGIGDLIIGTTHAAGGAGESYVVFGRQGGFPAAVNLADIAAGTGGFAITGASVNDGSGFTVASAGDVNGDGFADLIIGAPGYNGGTGVSYVVFGQAGGIPATVNLANVAGGTGGFAINAEGAGDLAGYSVAGAGDVNGDGIDDLIVGASGAAGGNGKSYLVFGTTTGFPSSINLAAVAAGTGGFVIDGSGLADAQHSGQSVAAAGDVNGDGFDDLLVGAALASPAAGTNAGDSYVIFGRDFTGAVTQQGSATPSLLTGTVAADDFVGGPANDTLIGNGGADVLLGGAGDDVIHISDTGFRRIDGGSGSNTLALDAPGMTLDLTALPLPALRDIADIDLGAGGNHLNVGALRVLDLSATSNTLRVDGTAGDSLSLGGETWSVGADAAGYVPYTNGQATLEVADAVTVACFAAGTRILTASGEVAVEDLIVGDAMPVLLGSRQRRVRWIGHRTLQLARHPRPWDVQPVRVSANAFGPGMPHADLRLSPDHAVHVDGALTPIRYLINGATIVQEAVAAVTYYHVELADPEGVAVHDVMLAQGLPAESFLDTGNRSAFANGGQPVDLTADFARRRWDGAACARLVVAGPALQHLRARLLAQAATLGWSTTDDPALHLRVDGATVHPDRHATEYRFALPAAARAARLVSRSMVPAEGWAEAEDTRRLGIAVSQLRLDGAAIARDDARLQAGWHADEAGWRWTDGDATLRCPDARELHITVLPLGRYWLPPAAPGIAGRAELA